MPSSGPSCKNLCMSLTTCLAFTTEKCYLIQMPSTSLLDIPWFAFDVFEKGTPDRKRLKIPNGELSITGNHLKLLIINLHNNGLNQCL